MAIKVDENTHGYPLGTVVIDGYRFDRVGYGMLQTANVLTYAESPKRSNTGAVYTGNYDAYVVPTCEIGFGLITIEQYMLLRRLLLARREHTVDYFDADYGRRVKHRMTVDDDRLKAFFSMGGRVIGMKDYTIKFEATLSPAETYKVRYHSNGGRVNGSAARQEFGETECYSGEVFKVSANEGVLTNEGKTLLYYCDAVENGAPKAGALKFAPDEEIMVTQDMTLYAVWGKNI